MFDSIDLRIGSTPAALAARCECARLVARAAHTDRAIGEDVTPCCLVNAGVFIARIRMERQAMARRMELERVTQVPQSSITSSRRCCVSLAAWRGLDLVRSLPLLHQGYAERRSFLMLRSCHATHSTPTAPTAERAAQARRALQVTSPHAMRIGVTSSSTRQAIRRFVSLVSRARQHYGVHGRSRRFRR